MSYNQPPTYEKQASPGPYLSLVGPDAQRYLSRVDGSGNRTPQYAVNISRSKPQVQLSRVVPNGMLRPLSEATLSSWSGKMMLSVQGHEVVLKQSWEGMQYNIYFDTPHGRLWWRPTSSANGMELWDAQKTKLAHYKYYKTEPELVVFIQVDPVLLDVIATAAIAIMVDDKKGLDIVTKIIRIAA